MCPVRKDIHANELGKVSMRNEYGKERNIEKIKIKYRKNEKKYANANGKYYTNQEKRKYEYGKNNYANE